MMIKLIYEKSGKLSIGLVGGDGDGVGEVEAAGVGSRHGDAEQGVAVAVVNEEALDRSPARRTGARWRRCYAESPAGEGRCATAWGRTWGVA